jgi:hypothetical protein
VGRSRSAVVTWIGQGHDKIMDENLVQCVEHVVVSSTAC